MFALYLNAKIKKNNPNNSLDNVMLELFRKSQQQDFSVQHFKNIIKAYIPGGIDKEILLYIDQGNTIELNNLMEMLPIVKVKIGAYNRGFDRAALIKEKIIKDINISSNAYKAGLRNGYKVIRWNFPKDRILIK